MRFLIKISTILFLCTSLQAGEVPPPIRTHYHGSTLFVGPTPNNVSSPQAVTNFFDYLNVYGIRSFESPDQMALSAWTFFRNGGEKLYVASPNSQSPEDYAMALNNSRQLDVDLVAVPAPMDEATREEVMRRLVEHTEKSPNRFGLIDPPKGNSGQQLISFARTLPTTEAAMYAPWIQSTVLQTPLPPSAAVAGVISRIDRERGVYKSPAGRSANLKGVEQLENSYPRDQLGRLNRAGVNLLRTIDETKPPMIFGARILQDPTTVDSPYIVTHRFLKLLKYSITKSLNGREAILIGSDLAKRYQKLIENYLDVFFRQGAFQGRTAREAYFSRCSFQNPKITCQVGASLLKPAEFLTFRLNLD